MSRSLTRKVALELFHLWTICPRCYEGVIAEAKDARVPLLRIIREVVRGHAVEAICHRRDGVDFPKEPE